MEDKGLKFVQHKTVCPVTNRLLLQEEDRLAWLDWIEISIHLASSNQILTNDKENENNGNDNNGWWNEGVGWRSYGNDEDGDEDQTLL